MYPSPAARVPDPCEFPSDFRVFARAPDAVAAAGALQQALLSEPWPLPSPPRVRMALRTGEAKLREGDDYSDLEENTAR